MRLPWLGSLLTAISTTPYKLYLLIDEYDNFANEVMISPLHDKDRYEELVQGEGTIKTLFKAVKSTASGRGLDRVFITGVSPVVLSDMTSGYNVAKSISQRPEFNDLCGFTAEEVQATLAQIAARHGLPAAQIDEAFALMRAFYNGYCFSPRNPALVYNPTLALYFWEALAADGQYPAQLLDDNLAMDRHRIQYVARLPHGETGATGLLSACSGTDLWRQAQTAHPRGSLHRAGTAGVVEISMRGGNSRPPVFPRRQRGLPGIRLLRCNINRVIIPLVISTRSGHVETASHHRHHRFVRRRHLDGAGGDGTYLPARRLQGRHRRG